MKKTYIRKTYYICITFILITFMSLAINVLMVQAENQSKVENTVTSAVSIDFTEKTMPQVLDAIRTLENKLQLIQEAAIVEELYETVYVLDPVNFRTHPSIDNEPMMLLSDYTELTRIGYCQNGWSKVEYDGIIGYIHSDYLTTVQIEKGTKGTYQKYALSLFDEYEWLESELEALIILWNRESNWNPNAENPSSGAYGIPQSLPGNKMSSIANDWQTNYKTQIQWGLKYISQRYGTPTNALQHSYEVGWY